MCCPHFLPLPSILWETYYLRFYYWEVIALLRRTALVFVTVSCATLTPVPAIARIYCSSETNAFVCAGVGPPRFTKLWKHGHTQEYLFLLFPSLPSLSPHCHILPLFPPLIHSAALPCVQVFYDSPLYLAQAQVFLALIVYLAHSRCLPFLHDVDNRMESFSLLAIAAMAVLQTGVVYLDDVSVGTQVGALKSESV